MFKKIILMFVLLIPFASVFAASCPASASFEKKGGWWGYYWDLPESANIEKWRVNHWLIYSNATTDVFPASVGLTVTFYNRHVNCDYALPAGNLKAHVYKTPDPKQLPSNLPTNSKLKTFSSMVLVDGPIDHPDKKIGICNTTAGNPTACSWQWSK